jgi:putative flippase GtrA
MGTDRRSGDAAARVVVALRAGSPGAQFLRFVLSGGTANLAYVASFLLLGGLGAQAANGVGSLLSAVVANELHRRLTFRASAAVGWRTAQWQGGLTLVAGLAASSSALAWLGSATGGTGPVVALLVAAGVNGLVGLARFATLRWLFTRRPAAGMALHVVVGKGPVAATVAAAAVPG